MAYDPNTDPNTDPNNPNDPLFEATPEFQSPPTNGDNNGYAGRADGNNGLPGGPNFDGLYHGEPFDYTTRPNNDAVIGGQPADWVNGDPGARGPNGYQSGMESDLRGVLPNAGGDPSDQVDIARRHNASLANGDAFGGAPTGPASNTATFPGDPSSGQTYGNPSITSPTRSTYDMMFNAQNGPGSGSLSRPTTPADLANIPGMSPSGGINPPLTDEAHFITRLGDSGLPGGKNGPTAADLTAAGATGDRILRNADGSIRGVKDASGYYSGDAFSGYDNIINNAQRGDPFALEKVHFLASEGDARAKTALGGIPEQSLNGVPAYQNSQNFADWATAHNQEIKANTTGNNPNHIGDFAPVPSAPMSNRDVYTVQNAWGNELAKAGYQDIKIDSYGNLTFTGSNGGQRIITPGWQAAQELAAFQAKQQAAPAAPPAAAPPGGGGGYGGGGSRYTPPRGGGYSPPRGGGGGGGGGNSGGGNAPAPTGPLTYSGDPTTAGAPGILSNYTNNVYSDRPAMQDAYALSPYSDAVNYQQAGGQVDPNAAIYHHGDFVPLDETDPRFKGPR